MEASLLGRNVTLERGDWRCRRRCGFMVGDNSRDPTIPIEGPASQARAGMLGSDVVRAAASAAATTWSALGHAELDITDATAVDAAVAEQRPGRGRQLRRLDRRRRRRGVTRTRRCAVNGDRRRDRRRGRGERSAPRSSTPPPTTSSTAARDAPYVESDQPAPLSAYGRIEAGRRGGDRGAPTRATSSSAPRGSSASTGANFVETMLRPRRRQRRGDRGLATRSASPTYTGHLAEGLVRLIEGDELRHPPHRRRRRCSWYEFAREIFDQAGVECRVLSATTDMLGRPAPRPASRCSSASASTPIVLPDWHDGPARLPGRARARRRRRR